MTSINGSGSRKISPVSSVPFIFGAVNAKALPGTILTSLLVDTGMSAAAARTVLARLRKRGGVEVERIGRAGVYRLSGPILSGFRRVGRGPQQEPWDGKFRTIVFDIPESERAVKDKLRALAAQYEFGTLRPGVLISTRDELPRLGLPDDVAGGFIETGLVEFDPDAAPTVAARAWDLAERADEFARACARIEQLTDPSSVPADPARAFRELHDNYLASIDVRLHDPDLPAELLPAGWKGGELDGLLSTMLAVWDDAVSAHIDATLLASPYRELVELTERPFDP